jgi:arylsulfatase A-like enzyme
VPLIISAPGFGAGKTEAIAELVDLYPTLCELVGLPVPEAVQGTSLVPVLRDPKASVKTGALSFSRGASLREKDWAYMRYTDGTEELYDMNRDPRQFVNQAQNPEYSATLGKLRERLETSLKAAEVPSEKEKGKREKAERTKRNGVK